MRKRYRTLSLYPVAFSGRLARQPLFDGNVTEGKEYIIVDDFIGMGGTIANPKGYIELKGGVVIGATALTGKSYSARIVPDRNILQEMRDKHGNRRGSEKKV